MKILPSLVILFLLMVILIPGYAFDRLYCPPEFENIRTVNHKFMDCFFFSQKTVTFTQALEDCSRRGSDLLVLQNPDEDVVKLIKAMQEKKIPSTTFWLGANRTGLEFRWSDGFDVRSRNIRGNDEFKIPCCLSLDAGVFTASRCYDLKFYICYLNFEGKDLLQHEITTARRTLTSVTDHALKGTLEDRHVEQLHQSKENLRKILGGFHSQTLSRNNWTIGLAVSAVMLSILIRVFARPGKAFQSKDKTMDGLTAENKGLNLGSFFRRHLNREHEDRDDEGFKEKDEEDDGRTPTVVPLCCLSS